MERCEVGISERAKVQTRVKKSPERINIRFLPGRQLGSTRK